MKGQMTVRRFLVEYLENFARITLVDENGDIFYEGDVASCRRELTRGLYIKSISGLGDNNDLIITCESR